jgi:DNA polymerase delta subunit 1
MKKAHKLPSYKLDNVCAHFLGSKKMDVAYRDIPKLQETRAGRLKMAAYCLKDSWLVLRLMDHLCTLSNLVEMSRVCNLPMNAIISRGQMIRSLAVIYYYARRHVPPYFLPEFVARSKVDRVKERRLGSQNKMLTMRTHAQEIEVEQGGYQGAVVIKPNPGFYTEPVACLDFASLYPSIMRWKNMCYSTLVDARTIAQCQLVEDVDYHRIRKVVVDDADNLQLPLAASDRDVCFLSKAKRPGILPHVLTALLSARKVAKRDMKRATSKHARNIANGRQLALKVCCNSVYGFTGTWYGYLPEQRIASSVTETGRYLALKTKKFCEETYPGCRCVYGDTSVCAPLPFAPAPHNPAVTRCSYRSPAPSSAPPPKRTRRRRCARWPKRARR